MDSHKILVIGDLHIKANNISDIQSLTLQIKELIVKNNYSFVVLLGDTLDSHERMHMVVYNYAVNFITDLCKITRVFLLIGNHDRVNNTDFQSNIHPFVGLQYTPNLHIIHRAQKFQIQNFKYIFVPYVPVGSFDSALQSIETEIHINSDNLDLSDMVELDTGILNNVSVVFAHQEFKGVNLNNKKSNSSDVWILNNPLLISGHIHEYSKLQPNLIYTGTPIQHTFAENPDKSVSELIVSKNEVNHNRIYLQNRKKITVNIQYNEISNFDICNYLDSYIKLIINGTNSELKSLVKNTFIEKLSLAGVKIKYNNIDKPEINNTVNLNLKNVSYLENLEAKIKDSHNLYILYKKILN
jgi:predicted phosphodiesterase